MPLRNQLADFDQDSVMADAEPYSAAAREGACLNFSLRWLAMMYESADSGGAMQRMRQLAVRAGAESRVLQGAYVRALAESGQLDAVERVATFRGLHMTREILNFSPFNRGALTAALDQTDTAGMLYCAFWGGANHQSQGHGIGFFRNLQTRMGRSIKADRNVVAFDPNNGECWIEEGLLGGWSDDFARQTTRHAHDAGSDNFGYHWLIGFRPA